jgi:hypothetical protein
MVGGGGAVRWMVGPARDLTFGRAVELLKRRRYKV